MTKPRLAFVGRIAGVLLCECGSEMKKYGEVYECANIDCKYFGKRYVAIISNAALFYEVQPT